MHRKAVGEVIVQPSEGDEEGKEGITVGSRGVGKSSGLRLYTLVFHGGQE